MYQIVSYPGSSACYIYDKYVCESCNGLYKFNYEKDFFEDKKKTQNKCRSLPPVYFPVIFNKDLAYYTTLAGKISSGYEENL